MSEEKWIKMPLKASLAMMDEAWGICGTDLSTMEPNSQRIREAQEKYRRLITLGQIALATTPAIIQPEEPEK